MPDLRDVLIVDGKVKVSTFRSADSLNRILRLHRRSGVAEIPSADFVFLELAVQRAQSNAQRRRGSGLIVTHIA